jgi:hypothetical protein
MELSIQDQAIRERLSGMVTVELVAEHRARPFGPHSPPLGEVLDFVRRNPALDLPRYVVLQEGEVFGVGVRPAERGAAVPRAGGEAFATRGEAEHAVFLRRLADYGLLP